MKNVFHSTIAAIAAVSLAATAWAGEVPDTARASRLQALSDAAWRVKVTTGERSRLLVRPRVDVEGITPREPAREPIPWERIRQVETQRHARGRGFAGGFVLGALGTAIAAGLVFDRGEEWGAAGIVLVPVVIGTGGLVGGWIGAATASKSETVYP